VRWGIRREGTLAILGAPSCLQLVLQRIVWQDLLIHNRAGAGAALDACFVCLSFVSPNLQIKSVPTVLASSLLRLLGPPEKCLKQYRWPVASWLVGASFSTDSSWAKNCVLYRSIRICWLEFGNSMDPDLQILIGVAKLAKKMEYVDSLVWVGVDKLRNLQCSRRRKSILRQYSRYQDC
jgi:hypothetical protein